MMTSWLAYSPYTLFSVGEQGVWFDPSDVANLNWRRNLLTYTEQFTASPWEAAVLGTSTRTNTTTPYSFGLGLITVTSANGGIRQTRTGLTSGQPYTLSFYLESAVANINVVFENGTAGFGAPHAASINPSTGAFSSVSGFTSTTSVAFGTGRIYTLVSATAGGTLTANIEWRVTASSGTFLLGRPQFEASATATDYQRITDVNTEVIERFPNATLYQDTAGTQPVTTTGQSVGLMLDKSRGLVLGPELVVNGGFATDTDWTKGTGWTISGGVATKVAGTSANIDQSLALTAGRSYQVTYTITSISVAGAFIRLAGATTVDGITRNTVGTFTEIVVAPASMTTLSFRAQSTTNVTVDNISIKELPGNHAVQATTANRPIYGIHPVGGRRNLLVRTEEFGNAVWFASNASITANTTVAPDGTMTADTIAMSATNGLVLQDYTTTTDSTYVYSVYLRADSATTAIVRIQQSGGAAIFQVCSLTTSWQRFQVSLTTSAVTFVRCLIQSNSNTPTLQAWGTQLEAGSTATAYQRVTDQYNVTEAGVSSVSYLFFDGVNDSLATPSINFTSTDKMTVFAGVRKNSDAALGCVAELSATVGGNNGAFNVFAPRAVQPGYSFGSKGTVTSEAIATTGFTAPISNVLTGVGDIAGDIATLRVNGTQAAQSTTDQGTGTYGNYPLFIGARNNADLRFNGHLYSLIVRGAQSNTGQISSTETWVASRTGIVI
jgi:hypothetical protein